jgi:hypothetical protein
VATSGSGVGFLGILRIFEVVCANTRIDRKYKYRNMTANSAVNVLKTALQSLECVFLAKQTSIIFHLNTERIGIEASKKH